MQTVDPVAQQAHESDPILDLLDQSRGPGDVAPESVASGCEQASLTAEAIVRRRQDGAEQAQPADAASGGERGEAGGEAAAEGTQEPAQPIDDAAAAASEASAARVEEHGRGREQAAAGPVAGDQAAGAQALPSAAPAVAQTGGAPGGAGERITGQGAAESQRRMRGVGGGGGPSGGGGGGTPEPSGGGQAPAPSGGGGGGGGAASSTADQAVVDDWMERNWDDAEYEQAYARIGGVPTGWANQAQLPVRHLTTGSDSRSEGGQQTEAPAEIPQSAVDAANALVAILGQAAEGLAIFALPFGPILVGVAELATCVGSIATAVGNYQDTDDEGGFAGEVVLTAGIIRSIADSAGNLVTRVRSAATVVEWVGLVGGVFSEGLSVAASGVGAAVNEATSAIDLIANLIKVDCDVAMAAGNAYLMHHHAAEGNQVQYQRARQLLEQNADNFLSDLISAGGDILSAFSIGLFPADALRSVGSGVYGAARAANPGGSMQAAARLATHARTRAGKAGTVDVGTGIANAEAGVMTGALDLALDAVDPFAVWDTGNVARSPVAADILNPAREQARADRAALQSELSGEKPHWYQKLITDFFESDEVGSQLLSGASELSSPEGRLRSLLRIIGPWVNEVTDGFDPEDLESAGNVLQTVATQLPQHGTTFAAFTAALNHGMSQLQERSGELATWVGQHRVSLQVVRDGLESGEGFIAGLERITDPGGQLDATLNSVMSRLTPQPIQPPQDITPALVRQLARYVPGLGPIASGLARVASSSLLGPVVQPLLERARGMINGFVQTVATRYNGALQTMRTTFDQSRQRLITEVDQRVGDMVTRVRQSMGIMQHVVAEGGVLEQLAEAKRQELQTWLQEVQQFAARWNGHMDLAGLGQWLGQVVLALRSVADPQGRDAEGEENSTEDLRAQWEQVMTTQAQPHVDGYRSKHGEQIDRLQRPRVSAGESEAFRRASDAVGQRIEAWRDSRADDVSAQALARRFMAQRAEADQRAASAAASRDASGLNELREAERDLVTVDRTVPDPGQGAGAMPQMASGGRTTRPDAPERATG